MVNVNKLKAKIVENGINVETLAEGIGLNKATLYRKLKESEKITLGETYLIARFLKLTPDEVNTIFFAEKVA